MKKLSKWMIFVLVLIALSFINIIINSFNVNKSYKNYGKNIKTVDKKPVYNSDKLLDTCQDSVKYITDVYSTMSSGMLLVLYIIIFFILYHYAS
jgi:hypothetical protein